MCDMHDPAAIELFNAHQHLAMKLARRRERRFRLAEGELVGPALEGLWQSARNYDPARGVAFSTYAMRRVHGAVVDYLRTVRDDRYRTVALYRPISLSFRLPSRHRETLADSLIDRRRADPQLAELLAAARQGLSERQQRVVELYYGRGLCDHEIGEVLGLKWCTVHFARQRALAHLRRALADRGIDCADAATAA